MTKPADRGTEADLEAIHTVREAHVASLNAGDADTWVSLFSDDGVQMPPNAPANVGRDLIGPWSRAFLGVFRSAFALSVEEVRMAGDWAFERGTYRITLTPKAGGEAIQDRGKYITIYQRQPGGAWRIARDIWNTDNPLPGTRS
jgi:uncharacterized protein (TIGR02246 family)